jgi:hypothetical protein
VIPGTLLRGFLHFLTCNFYVVEHNCFVLHEPQILELYETSANGINNQYVEAAPPMFSIGCQVVFSSWRSESM